MQINIFAAMVFLFVPNTETDFLNVVVFAR